MRVQLVDPAAYTPAYDHALAAALASAGADVELATSRFGYGAVPAPEGYVRRETFYRSLPGGAGSRLLRAGRGVRHMPDMLAWRRSVRSFDLVHVQWTPFQAVDRWLLPRGVPLVMTAHDVLPREPRPGQVEAQAAIWRRADAVVVHTEHGRRRLVDEVGLDPGSISVIPHGPFNHLVVTPHPAPLPPELEGGEGPVVLMFGLVRPYKGLDVLLDAWRSIEGARLWVVGRQRIDTTGLTARAPDSVKFLDRYVDDREIPAIFRAADVCVLPYREIDQSGVLATALAFGRPLLLSDAGGFPEVAAAGAGECVPAGDPMALADRLRELLADQARRERLAEGAKALAAGPWSWGQVARLHLDLYRKLLEIRRGDGRGGRSVR